MPPQPARAAGAVFEQRENPAAVARGGALPSAVARLPQRDVSGAVIARVLKLDEAAANPARPEFRGRDLQVHVGLAARLGDLAPARADLVALSGIDPVIGGVVGVLVDGDDADRRADIEGPERAGVGAVILLAEGSECNSHDSLLF